QVLTPIFDPTFSEFSFGFRPGRSAHDAIKLAREYIEAGYDWVVDFDLAKFFDRVNHDKLMVRISRRVEDKRVLHLIRRYLQAGVMLNGVVVATEEGPRKAVHFLPCSETSCSMTSTSSSKSEVTGSAATLTTATFTFAANAQGTGRLAPSVASSISAW